MIEDILQKSKKRDFQVEEVYKLIEETMAMFEQSERFANHVENELANVDSVLSKALKGRYLGGFGLGYPFYAKNKDGYIQINEISNFLRNNLVKIQDVIAKEDIWKCTRCQEENQLPDLKIFCKKCEQVAAEMKPRKILSMLPDMDMLVVVDVVDPSVLKQIEETLHENKYFQSDISIRNAVTNTREVLSALKKGEIPKEKLPIDLHVISMEQFDDMVKAMSGGEKPTLLSNSLHMKWESYELPFWFDFIFSATEFDNISPEFKEKIIKFRRALKDHYGVDGLISQIKTNPRAMRILQTDKAEEAFRNKINSW